ncbi:hypothetical protein ALC60_03091 [Trachymyrmex zeteki]|uniref:Uncharacterized protein n=1 Tax=Mycetomoellerius zeteki TaxID=64791 RepID=A0A151XCG9_9HYME|nr:hypothetical protein ALC60_03091 [Trachymyrmex zeteki]
MLVSKNVALSCQRFVALPATEVTAVPVLSWDVSSEFYRNIKHPKVLEASKKIASLQGTNMGTYLVACSASWFKLFRIMPLTEKHVVVHAISKIDQEFFTIRASKARRMIEETHRILFKKCVQQKNKHFFYTHEISLKNFLYATDVQSDLIPGGHEIIGAAGMFGIQMATIGPC